ncbi:MAG: OB-fold nucleic acid binding domain-containing protein, partial [Chloroflexi bacterium]|nr:OB-fold nucleic acid binding domain-containing protein [Chloroflexota bacterium]
MVTPINELSKHAGEIVTLQGWLYARTDKGKLVFMQVRDGTGIAQCVVFKREVDEQTFESALHLP